MLLYRPLIIDWLPVPPSFPTRPTKPLLLHPPPSPTLSLSPCLIVSPPHPLCLVFLPIMSPSLPISSSVPLFLFSSCCCTSSGLAAPGAVLQCVSISSCLLYFTCAAFKCCRCTLKRRRSVLITHLSSSSALHSGSDSAGVNRRCF